jgi:hypothetical protein
MRCDPAVVLVMAAGADWMQERVMGAQPRPVLSQTGRLQEDLRREVLDLHRRTLTDNTGKLQQLASVCCSRQTSGQSVVVPVYFMQSLCASRTLRRTTLTDMFQPFSPVVNEHNLLLVIDQSQVIKTLDDTGGGLRLHHGR